MAMAIAAGYALLGIAWIVASDALVLAISDDPAWVRTAQRYKGVFYVLLTAVGLCLLVRQGYLRLLRAADEARSARLAALQQQEEHFRQLHDSLGEVLWLAMLDGRRLLYVSPAFQALYGRAPADLMHDPGLWLAAVHPDDRERARASARELAERGETRCEYRIVRPDGSVRWVADRKRRIDDAEGRPGMIGGIAEDITAAKERDAARAVTQAELERRVAERTESLQRMNAELDAFARTAAHDMKSPLNAIGGLSYLLQHKYAAALGDDGRRMLGHIETSTHHLAALVNDLLALSRVSSSTLRWADVDLAEVARELLDEMRRHEPDRQVRLDAPVALVLRCDSGLVRSLLANLLGNAWKYSGRREIGHIRLALGDAGGAPVVAIEDNGAGFDAGDGVGPFKPFRRFHADSEFSGTGIGLVTCERIVARHGGAMRVDSVPGVGTVVQFSLQPATLQPLAPRGDAGNPALTLTLPPFGPERLAGHAGNAGHIVHAGQAGHVDQADTADPAGHAGPAHPPLAGTLR